MLLQFEHFVLLFAAMRAELMRTMEQPGWCWGLLALDLVLLPVELCGLCWRWLVWKMLWVSNCAARTPWTTHEPPSRRRRWWSSSRMSPRSVVFQWRSYGNDKNKSKPTPLPPPPPFCSILSPCAVFFSSSFFCCVYLWDGITPPHDFFLHISSEIASSANIYTQVYGENWISEIWPCIICILFTSVH